MEFNNCLANTQCCTKSTVDSNYNLKFKRKGLINDLEYHLVVISYYSNNIVFVYDTQSHTGKDIVMEL